MDPNTAIPTWQVFETADGLPLHRFVLRCPACGGNYAHLRGFHATTDSVELYVDCEGQCTGGKLSLVIQEHKGQTFVWAEPRA